MKVKRKRLHGKFICDRTENELNRLQKIRAVLYAVMLVAFIVPPLVLKQSALKTLDDNNMTALQTVYVLLISFTALWTIFSFICSFTRYRLKKEIYANNAPKNGFEKHTWAVVEWQLYLMGICAATHFALTVYRFSMQSLIVLLLGVAATVCAYFIKKISFEAYVDKITFLSVDDELAQNETEETDGTISSAQTSKPETNLKTYSEDAEKNLSEEVEDFYDRD